MPINLNNKVGQSDIDKVLSSRNPSEYAGGYEDDESGGADMGDFAFDDMDDNSGGSIDSAFDDPFGSSGGGGGGSTFGQSGGFSDIGSFGQSGGFGQDGLGQSVFGQTGFGQGGAFDPYGNTGAFPGQAQNNVPPKPDTFEKIMEAGGEGLKGSWEVFVDIFKSVKCRNVEDWSTYWRSLSVLGMASAGVGIVLGIVGAIGKLSVLNFMGLPINLVLGGCLCFGTGLLGIGMAAFKILKINDDSSLISPDYLGDIPSDDGNNLWDGSGNDEADSSIFDDILKEFNSGDVDESQEDAFSFVDDPEENENESENENDEFKFDFLSKMSDYSGSKKVENMADSVPESVPLINRKFLFETFKGFFVTNCDGFSDKREIDPSSDEFQTIRTLALKALGSVANKDFNTLESELITLEETKFCYLLTMTREKKLTNLPAIEKEMVAYFRDSVDDQSVNAIVDIAMDNYKIVLTKGNTDIITLGDCFKLKEVCDFYTDPKVALPIIAGITDLGEPLLLDAKKYDTMLIAGKPRSGKSWYLNSIVISLCAFNSPEDVQLLIIDPKMSYLFKSVSMLPHVCGLHNHKNILEILNDVVEKEGSRRKKLLSDNEVDDIWALRKKGIALPILYIVIDEYMTVVNYLGASKDELSRLMQTIISQLPSQGIRVIFVPHRSKGVVELTVRTLLSFSAAVRADIDTVQETLGIKKWSRDLTNPGDTALKLADQSKAYFLRGAALCLDDLDNTEFIKNLAKTFYKMGVDIPDMTSIGCGYNRDEEEIKDKLGNGDSAKRVQYNVRADLEKM